MHIAQAPNLQTNGRIKQTTQLNFEWDNMLIISYVNMGKKTLQKYTGLHAPKQMHNNAADAHADIADVAGVADVADVAAVDAACANT